MSGETERNISGWTTDTLKEYLESLIISNDKRYSERFDAQEVANKYDQEKSNEFRGALDDVGKRQMPRTEAEAEFKSIRSQSEGRLGTLNETIAALSSRLDRMESRGAVTDPAAADLVKEVRQLAKAQEAVAGEKSGKLSQQQLLQWIIYMVLAGLALAAYFKR